jgi:hypothetical protein
VTLCAAGVGGYAVPSPLNKSNPIALPFRAFWSERPAVQGTPRANLYAGPCPSSDIGAALRAQDITQNDVQVPDDAGRADSPSAVLHRQPNQRALADVQAAGVERRRG